MNFGHNFLIIEKIKRLKNLQIIITVIESFHLNLYAYKSAKS